MPNKRAYNRIAKEAAALGLPKAYKSDLLWHDRHLLEQMASGTPFGWIVRDCGTNFVGMACVPGDWGETECKFYAKYADARFYYHDGRDLRPVTAEGLRTLALGYYSERLGDYCEQGYEYSRAIALAKLDTDKRHAEMFGSVHVPDLPDGWKADD